MAKRYEIVQNAKDDYTLKYKDKEINFHSTVDMVAKLQEANKTARTKMILDLAKQGMSIKDLIKVEKREGKTYYDNSNKEELEKYYIISERELVFLNVVKDMLKVDLQELIADIGFENQEETENFSKELGEVITGRFPSR